MCKMASSKESLFRPTPKATYSVKCHQQRIMHWHFFIAASDALQFGDCGFKEVRGSGRFCMEKIKSILLIDDDAICCWFNKVLLEEMGIAQSVECISDGESALGYLQEACCRSNITEGTCPDLIFLDINMPGINGFEVLKRLKVMKGCDEFSFSKVVLLTTSMSSEDQEEARSYRVHGYLVKPLTETKIKGIVESYLKRFSDENFIENELNKDHFIRDRKAAERPKDAADKDMDEA